MNENTTTIAKVWDFARRYCAQTFFCDVCPLYQGGRCTHPQHPDNRADDEQARDEEFTPVIGHLGK